MIKTSLAEKIFRVFNYVVLTGFAFICLAPLLHVLAMSFSSSTAIENGLVSLFPVQPIMAAYNYVLSRHEFVRSLLVSIGRILLGVPVNLILALLTAYPLSKEVQKFKWRTVYAWFFVFTMLFSGGLIPTFMIIFKTGLIDSIWSLILPGAVQVFNVVLLLNFFRALPKEMEESAALDGAGHLTTLLKIYLPLSGAAISTIALFSFVGHWNSWFDGIIYMNSTKNYPLQSYLQSMVIKVDFYRSVSIEKSIPGYNQLSNGNLKASQIILAMLPLLIVYPFIQRYFSKGIILGSVKE